MNTPILDNVLELYRKVGEPDPAWSLQEDVSHYLRHGYLFSAPRYFIMGSRISDGWHIHVAAGIGALKEFCELMPYWLPFVGWCRRTKGREQTKWHETNVLVRKLGYDSDEFKNRKFDPLQFRGRRSDGHTSTTASGEISSCGEYERYWSEQAERIPIHYIDRKLATAITRST